MMIKTKVALAVLAAGLSSQVLAVELGEFNGTKFNVGGYLKAETVFDRPDDGKNTVEGSVRQSRFNLGTSSMVEGHKVRGFIEGDFWDNNTSSDSSYAWRLRHAYINIDNVTVGQTWNGQFYANAPFDTEMINFWGLGIGTIAGNGAPVRPDLVVHYTTNGWRFTLQDPVYSNADVPDAVVAYTRRTQSGHAFNVALTGREVDTTPTVDSDDQSDYGVAISLASKLKFGDTSLSLSAFTGEGAGVYAGWGYLGNTGPSGVTEVDSNGDMVTLTGFSAGIGHKFSDKLRANLRYGQVHSDKSALSEATLQQTTLNMIYTYLPQVELGIELRDQNAANRPPSSQGTSARPAGSQVELMAMYKF
ncbi:porin [Marinomonas gallaica]|uniref:porin n=1 Tax=Marinomonas gallaica TaxID=1806667 RepID=UPI0008347DA7|nr:porin [Marinomonas gallaica]